MNLLSGRTHILLLLIAFCLGSCGNDDRSVSPERLATLQENVEIHSAADLDSLQARVADSFTIDGYLVIEASVSPYHQN